MIDGIGMFLSNKKLCPDCGFPMQNNECPECGYGMEDDGEEEGVEVSSLLEILDDIERIKSKVKKLIENAD